MHCRRVIIIVYIYMYTHKQDTSSERAEAIELAPQFGVLITTYNLFESVNHMHVCHSALPDKVILSV